ncbi:MAG: arsenate reductase ArsC [Candidatus Bipolaricaulia bacterium]
MKPKPKLKLMFICVGNSCRSQMAEGFARHHAGDRIEVASGGTAPAGYVSPNAVAVMREVGIDISSHRSTGIDSEALLEYDYVITMGCSDRDVCPADFTGVSRDWGIRDPVSRPIEVFRHVRDEIEMKVMALLEEILGEG